MGAGEIIEAPETDEGKENKEWVLNYVFFNILKELKQDQGDILRGHRLRGE